VPVTTIEKLLAADIAHLGANRTWWQADEE
jgi:hypothetical protein